MFDHPQVGQLPLLHQLQQRAHARRVHIDGDEIHVRCRRGNFGRRIPHAKADLQHHGGTAAEHLRIVQRPRCKGQTEHRHQPLPGITLRGREVRTPQHIGADAAPGRLAAGVFAAGADGGSAHGCRLPGRVFDGSGGFGSPLSIRSGRLWHCIRGSQRGSIRSG